MGRFAQLVMGPAGSGKSTYCAAIVKHCEAIGRSIHVLNLDPAAEHFEYTPSIDVRELITVEDVMDSLQLGPNGGLIWCLEYVISNIEWLQKELGAYEDDYLLIDCPGQVELFTHVPVMSTIVKEFIRWDYAVCGVFLLDSHFMSDSAKFLSGSLLALSSMIQLELPHVNVMSKMDLINRDLKRQKEVTRQQAELAHEEEREVVREAAVAEAEEETESRHDAWLERRLNMHVDHLVADVNKDMSERFWALNSAIGEMLDDFNMVSFLPLDVTEEESIGLVLQHIDHALQYGEDLEPKEPEDAVDLYDFE